MTADEIGQANETLREKSPLEVMEWAIGQAGQGGSGAIVSTNFRPYEAVILHLATQVQPDIRVLWVDHGYNREATYQHAEELKAKLNLNIQAFVPKYTTAYYDAVYGGVPELTEENEEAIKAFSTAMKLEPFQRGMRDLAPTVWLTALRKVQNPNRAELDIVSPDNNFNSLKVSPVFHWAKSRWRRISPSMICRTSGITLTQPRPMRSASAGCTQLGEERQWRQNEQLSSGSFGVPRDGGHPCAARSGGGI